MTATDLEPATDTVPGRTPSIDSLALELVIHIAHGNAVLSVLTLVSAMGAQISLIQLSGRELRLGLISHARVAVRIPRKLEQLVEVINVNGVER